jgi:hypothetical protein
MSESSVGRIHVGNVYKRFGIAPGSHQIPVGAVHEAALLGGDTQLYSWLSKMRPAPDWLENGESATIPNSDLEKVLGRAFPQGTEAYVRTGRGVIRTVRLMCSKLRSDYDVIADVVWRPGGNLQLMGRVALLHLQDREHALGHIAFA